MFLFLHLTNVVRLLVKAGLWTLFALLALLASQPARAQGAQFCTPHESLTICGDEFDVDFLKTLGFPEGSFLVEGNVKMGPRGGEMVLGFDGPATAVGVPGAATESIFFHIAGEDELNETGAQNYITGEPFFLKDPKKTKPLISIVHSIPGHNGLEGIFWVDPVTGVIDVPRAFAVPVYDDNGITEADYDKLYKANFIQDMKLEAFNGDPEQKLGSHNILSAQFSVLEKKFLTHFAIPKLRLASNQENGDIPLLVTLDMTEDGIYSMGVDSFKLKLAGMTASASGIVANQEEMQIGTLDFSKADNPTLPALDPNNPNSILKLQSVKYKDGKFAIGATVGMPDWQLGSAFRLTRQSVGIFFDEVKGTNSIVISSTLTFPQDAQLSTNGQFPMAITISAEKVDGFLVPFGRGTFKVPTPPELRIGPLSFVLPATTALVIDPRQNFFGLEAQQVTLRWNGSFGGKSGVSSNFKLGVDKNRNMVFRLAGGTVTMPELSTGALSATLNATFNVDRDLFNVFLRGTARLKLPGNSGVAPTVEMELNSGRIVCKTATQTACFKPYAMRLSGFELKVAGFTLGLNKPRGTNDGGFAVDVATLKVPVGAGTLGGSVTGFVVTGSGDVRVTGGSFELPPLQIGKFSFVGVRGSFFKTNAGGYEFKGRGVMPLPGLDPSGGAAGKKLTVDLAIRTNAGGDFSGLGVGLEFQTNSPGIPIAGTGFELLKIGGAFDLNNSTAKISVTMRAGSQLQVVGVPVASIDAKADLQVNPFLMTANAELSLLIFKVANAGFGIGAGQGFNGGTGFNVSFDVDAIVVHGHTALRIGSVTLSNGQKSTRVAAESSWAVGIKKNQFARFLPPGDIFLSKVSFKGGHLRHKNGRETIGLMATVGCCIFFDTTVLADFGNGLDVSFIGEKDYQILGAAQVRAAVAAAERGFAAQMVPASTVMGADRINAAALDASALVLQETIPVQVDEPGGALFGIAYPEGSPILRLQLPDGTILTEQTVDHVNSTFLRHTATITEPHEVAFLLGSVQPGVYTMILDNAPPTYEKVSYLLDHAPTLSEVAATCGGVASEGVTVTCNGAPAGSQVTITWNAQDQDTANAQVRISYSPVLSDSVTLDSANQTILTETLPLGVGSFTWQLDEVPTGNYRLIVSVEDGNHAPVETVAEPLISIVDRRAPATPSGLQAEPQPGELLVTWTPNTERDVAGYEIGFGVVDPALPDDPGRFVYSRDLGAKEVQLPTGNLLDAKLWGLTDNQAVFVGIRVYDQSGNVSPWSPLLRAQPWPLSPVAWTPAPNGEGGMGTGIELVFETALISETLTGALQLQTTDGTLIPGVQEPIFNLEGDAVIGLRFRPTTPLVEGALYTASVKGGEAGLAAVDGRRLPVAYKWSFTAALQTGMTQLFLPLVSR
jgi:hypothetical protein